MMAKIGVVNLHLLSHQELKEINIKTLELFKIRVIGMTEDVITIVIRYPIFKEEKCQTYEIIPVPNMNNSELAKERLEIN